MVGGGRPLPPENIGQTDPTHQNSDFQSIFARGASVVTPGEESLINTKQTRSSLFLSNEYIHSVLSNNRSSQRNVTGPK